MKATSTPFIAILAIGLLFSCQTKDKLTKKKEKLKALKTEVSKKREEIDKLEKEIALEDPDFAKANRKEQLITAIPVTKELFIHYVETSGSVESDRNVMVSAENMGVIESIKANEGQIVKRGEVIMQQNTDILSKQLAQYKTQYELAATIFEKQSNLWDKNIGTEVQYLEAKNNKENLETQIDNVKAQIAKSIIRAPFSGSIEKIDVKEGEMAQPGTPLYRIVSLENMYVEADVSEKHVGSFKKGDSVKVFFPSLDKTIEVKLTSVGQVIDQQNRTFRVEARLPKLEFNVKPNLLAVMKLKDFEKPDASIVPKNLIQKDNKGDFVYIIEDKENTKVATKVHVTRGMTYQSDAYVSEGLKGNETLVDHGFREVIDGSKVKIVDNVL